MGVYIKGMEIPRFGYREIIIHPDGTVTERPDCSIPGWEENLGKAIPVPDHGDLIDRDALIKDGWINLHKEVMRMGGYAIHELPLKNPSIAVIIPASEGGE